MYYDGKIGGEIGELKDLFHRSNRIYFEILEMEGVWFCYGF
jgi:hypothetical protein